MNTRTLLQAALTVGVAALALGFACEPERTTTTPGQGELLARCQQLSARDFVPENARFEPGSLVRLLVEVSQPGDTPCAATLHLEVTQLGDRVLQEARELVLAGAEPQQLVLEWRAPPDDFRGYMATLTFDEVPVVLSTGVDISSNSVRYPRYGYFSDFPPGQTPEESEALVRVLAQRFHLNMFQFYDWFWKHEDLVPEASDGGVPEQWTDLFDRVNGRDTISQLISASHRRNALATAYVAMYAAREGYEQSGVSPKWGLYETPAADRQVALAFSGPRYLFLFDPSNPQWQDFMERQYVDALKKFDFDGVHIDQFGPRPTLYRADGTAVELNETFVPFLEAIDETLTREVPGRAFCVFNLVEGRVDGYAVEAVAATTACDILYSELWFSNDTYEDLRAFIDQLRRVGGRRAVVLAVYPQYGEDIGPVLEAEAARLVGVTRASNHAGYSGQGFVDGFDAEGDSITWQLELSETATTTLVFRYANATAQQATRTVMLDGKAIGKVRFGERTSWDDWAFDAWLQVRSLPAGRHQVQLLYAPDDSGAVNIDRLALGEFDEESVRLQNAVMFASGATPIQVGDDLQSLAHEYYPNRSKTLTPALQRALASQFSFITAHERLLFAPEVVPIDARLERIEAVSPGHLLIDSGVGGIWTVLRSAPEGEVIHLVNLVGVDNARWRDAAPQPTPQTGVVLRFRVDSPEQVRRVLWATPDEGRGTFNPRPFRVGDGWIEFEVPRLSYWDVVLVQR